MRTAIAFLAIGGVLLLYGAWLRVRIAYNDSDSAADLVLFVLGGFATLTGLFGLSWELAVRGQSWFAWTLGALVAGSIVVACERSVRR